MFIESVSIILTLFQLIDCLLGSFWASWASPDLLLSSSWAPPELPGLQPWRGRGQAPGAACLPAPCQSPSWPAWTSPCSQWSSWRSPAEPWSVPAGSGPSTMHYALCIPIVRLDFECVLGVSRPRESPCLVWSGCRRRWCGRTPGPWPAASPGTGSSSTDSIGTRSNLYLSLYTTGKPWGLELTDCLLAASAAVLLSPLGYLPGWGAIHPQVLAQGVTSQSSPSPWFWVSFSSPCWLQFLSKTDLKSSI